MRRRNYENAPARAATLLLPEERQPAPPRLLPVFDVAPRLLPLAAGALSFLLFCVGWRLGKVLSGVRMFERQCGEVSRCGS